MSETETIFPKTVRIGPFDYTISEMSELESERTGFIGLHNAMRLEIKVRFDMPPQRQAEVLMHEIMHGIWHAKSLGRGADEEIAVENISIGLMEFWRDNPGVIAFIEQQMSMTPCT